MLTLGVECAMLALLVRLLLALRELLCVFAVDEVSTRLELWGLVFGADFGLCLL
jgi:hypothetical protein